MRIYKNFGKVLAMLQGQISTTLVMVVYVETQSKGWKYFSSINEDYLVVCFDTKSISKYVFSIRSYGQIMHDLFYKQVQPKTCYTILI